MIVRTLRAALVAFVLLGASLSFAQPKPDSEGFVPAQPGEVLSPSESLPARGLVAGAYGFILAAIVVWTASVAVRAARLEAEVRALREKIGA